MTTHTTTTTADITMSAAPLAEEQPAYRYVGNGTFEPANQSALDECAAWNTFADRWNARTTRSAVQ